MSIPTPRSRTGLRVVSYDTEDNCEKALTNIQNSEQDPITLDKEQRETIKRLDKHDDGFGRSARAQRRLRRQRRHPPESGQKVGVTRVRL